MSLRIAFLLPAPFATVSGGYIYARRVVEGLRARGHAVEVVELGGAHPLPDAAAEAAAAAALDALPSRTRLLVDGLALPAFAPLAARLAEAGAVGLIHHPTSLETGAPAAAQQRLGEIERALFPRLPRVVASSPTTTRQLAAAFGVEPDRITTIEPGTDPAPRARGSGGPGCAILSVGTLVPRKGHDVLLQALARLTDLDWSLTIAGAPRDPVHAHGLAALAEQLGITSRVTFAGECAAPTLDALYDRSDVFALATHWEGYGMVAAEAMARGLPLAITAGGAIAEVVAPGAAVVSPPGDHASLSRGLRRLIYDTGLRAAMAEAAWQGGQRLPRWPDRAAAFERALAADPP